MVFYFIVLDLLSQAVSSRDNGHFIFFPMWVLRQSCHLLITHQSQTLCIVCMFPLTILKPSDRWYSSLHFKGERMDFGSLKWLRSHIQQINSRSRINPTEPRSIQLQSLGFNKALHSINHVYAKPLFLCLIALAETSRME